MDEFAVFTPEKAQKLSEMLDAWEKSPKDRGPDSSSPLKRTIVFKNDSGQAIPPYSLMQARTTVSENGFVYAVVERAFDYDATQSVVLVNNDFEVAVGQYGTAQDGPVYRIKTDGAITYETGDRIGWKSNSFQAALGCLFSVIGDDPISINVVKAIRDDSSAQAQSISAINAGSSGSVYMRKLVAGAWTTDTTKQYIAYNDSTAQIQANVRISLHPVDGRFVVTSLAPSDSDTLETFQMTSNWLGGIATATFTNLSEPAYGTSAGILEDPEGIFVDVLGAGGRGLSIRTRYGRHYVIQAKCAQTLTPPATTGKCDIYIEGQGAACIVTTAAACAAVGGTYGGNGTTCP